MSKERKDKRLPYKNIMPGRQNKRKNCTLINKLNKKLYFGLAERLQSEKRLIAILEMSLFSAQASSPLGISICAMEHWTSRAVHIDMAKRRLVYGTD